MPYESSKSNLRRQFDRRFSTQYFVGTGIDIGCGPDPVSMYKEQFPLMQEVRLWDQNDGDGKFLEGIEDESFDFVHSSHSLEHMSDPTIAMTNWIRVCKKGGHIIITIPDEDMFEQGVWPSTYAGSSHITSWTIGKTESWCGKSLNVIEFFKQFLDNVEILKIEKIDHMYQYDAPPTDQTRFPVTECAIEVILRKKTDDEIKNKGRFPPKNNEVFVYKTS